MKLEVAQDLVRARCWGRCEGCGAFGSVQVHHRNPRGMGGVSRAAAERSNSPDNMLALCPRCHNETEDASTWRQCVGLGWRLLHGDDPASVPALIHTVQGYGWWFLDNQGGYRWADLDNTHRMFTWREAQEDGIPE